MGLEILDFLEVLEVLDFLDFLEYLEKNYSLQSVNKKKREPSDYNPKALCSLKKGGYLLSHFVGSTIGVGGLNFSVRNGKRWNTAAIAT